MPIGHEYMVRTHEPNGPVDIDRNHPLAKHISFAMYGMPYVASRRGALFSGTVRSTGQYGKAVTLTSTGITAAQNDVSRTVFVICRNTSSGGIIKAGAGGTSGWDIVISSGNTQPIWTDYGVANYTLPALWTVANQWKKFAIRRDRGSANDIRLFDEYGSQVGSAVAAGSYNAGTYEFTNTTTPTTLIVVVEQALSQEVIRGVLANPWQLFEPDPIPMYWPSAAPGGFSPWWASAARARIVGAGVH